MSDRKRPRVATDDKYSLAAIMGPPDHAADPVINERWDVDVVRFARAQLAAKVIDQAATLRKLERKIADCHARMAPLRAVPDTLARISTELRATLRRTRLSPPDPGDPPPDEPNTTSSAPTLPSNALVQHYLADICLLLDVLAQHPNKKEPHNDQAYTDLHNHCRKLKTAADQRAILKHHWEIKETDLKNRLDDATLELAHRRQQLAKYRHKAVLPSDTKKEDHSSANSHPAASSPAPPPPSNENNKIIPPSADPASRHAANRPPGPNGDPTSADARIEHKINDPPSTQPSPQTPASSTSPDTANQIRNLQREISELRMLAEMRKKEIADNLEERKKLLLDLETSKIALAVKPDLDQIVASALYHTMEVALQQCLLRQRDWERERLLLVKERDTLRDFKEKQIRTITETNDRKIAQLNAQLTDSIRLAEHSKSSRDKLQLQYESKKLGAGAEERAKITEDQLDTLRSRYDALSKEWTKVTDDFKLRCHEIDLLRTEVSKGATGSTQMAIEQLQREIKSEREKSSGFMVEIESLSLVFSDMESQNRKLSQALAAKEKALANLNSERLKHKQQVISIKEENKVLLSKMHAEEERSKLTLRALETTRKQNAESLEAVHRAGEEAAARGALADERKRIADEAVERERAALVEIDDSTRARDAAFARLQELIPKHQDQLAAIRRGEEKIAQLELRLQNASETKAAKTRPSTSGHKVNQEEHELLLHYRRKVNCSVNPSLAKDVTLHNCGHCFSRKCTDDLMAVRNRKCPICHVKFGQDDVQRIYLG